MQRTIITFATVLLTTSACGYANSPHFDIHVIGTEQLAEVDTAWVAACALGQADPATLASHNWLLLTVEHTPIEDSETGSMYAGVANDDLARVYQREGASLLDSTTPTVHEFLHVIYWLQTGDADLQHTHAAWHRANGDFSANQ